MNGYMTVIAFAPVVIPLVAILVVLIGRRTEEDEKAAFALAAICALATFVAIGQHDLFGGYLVAISSAITALALAVYIFWRRREAY